jgi:hypothetical protein
MIDHRCPNCDQLIRSSPHLAGLAILCPHCRSVKVQVPDQPAPQLAAGTAPNEPAVPRHDSRPPEPRARSVRRCFVCREMAEAEVYYLRVNKGSVGVGTYRAQWINLRCPCCDRCYGKLRGLLWFRLGWALFGFFGFPLVFCVGVPLLLIELGAPRTFVGGVYLGVAAALSMAVYVAVPVCLHFALKRRLLKLLHPDAANTLQSLGLGWNAGLTSELLPSRKPPPAGQPVVDFESGAGQL